jgi:putative hydrolase of the HAD superfamily
MRAYRGLLLDMNGTFMFGQDRFGEGEDYFETYCALGGTALPPWAVNEVVRGAVRRLAEHYADPGRIDDFPSVEEVLASQTSAPIAERKRLADVLAAHELGDVPSDYCRCLHRLGAAAPMGVVSNIWSRKDIWLRRFEQRGVGGIWRTMVFSSDGRSIKPSPAMFAKALAELGLHPGEVLFIGDSLGADIVPAKALGMATAWVGAVAQPDPSADWVAPSLLRLETMLS